MKILLFMVGVFFSLTLCADEKFDRLLKAAEEGNSKAQHGVAMSYFIDKNNELAIYWYRRAVIQGNEKSLYNLGMLYCSGYGVEENIEACYALVSLIEKDISELNGTQFQLSVRPRAKEKLENLSAQMTDDQIITAQVLAAEMSKPDNLLIALDAHIEKAKQKALKQ